MSKSQTERDSAKAASRTSSQNSATQRDTARAGARVEEDSADSQSTMDAREAAAGLNLAGNDPMSGRGQDDPTMSQREAAAGLTLAGNNTTSGRESLDNFEQRVSDAAGRAMNPDFGEVGTPQGNDRFDSASNQAGGGGGEADFAFKVVDDGDGTVSVLPGSINTYAATGLTPGGKPTELWLKATIASGAVSGASIVTASVADSDTASTRKVADITWNGDVPSITQGIKGSQNIVSCGASHGWSSLYL